MHIFLRFLICATATVVSPTLTKTLFGQDSVGQQMQCAAAAKPRDRVRDADQEGNSEQLVSLLQSLFNHLSNDSVAGGHIEYITSPEVLVIAQSEANHRKVGELLAKIRRLKLQRSLRKASNSA